jgi:hypothetical protein
MLRKLDYQKEIVTLLVLAFNNDHRRLLFLKQHVNTKMVDLKIKIARFKLKKLGETNYSLWIMLVKPIQRVNLTFV